MHRAFLLVKGGWGFPSPCTRVASGVLRALDPRNGLRPLACPPLPSLQVTSQQQELLLSLTSGPSRPPSWACCHPPPGPAPFPALALTLTHSFPLCAIPGSAFYTAPPSHKLPHPGPRKEKEAWVTPFTSLSLLLRQVPRAQLSPRLGPRRSLRIVHSAPTPTHPRGYRLPTLPPAGTHSTCLSICQPVNSLSININSN